VVKQNLKINGKKSLSKILWNEKQKEVKMMFLLLLPKVTNHRIFQGPPSKMLPHWPSNIGFISRVTNVRTFHWPPSCGLPLPFTFFFYLKAQI
jgi:hypothetical protein